MKLDTRSFYEQAVQQAIEHIAANLDEALELQTLATGACLSPFHFHRIFRGMAGETPVEMVRRLRMERAAFRLLETSTSVTEIAFDAGYETHEAFTRAFRLAFNMTPTAFRNKVSVRVQLAATNGIHFSADGLVPAFIPRDSGGRNMTVDIVDMPEMRLGAVRHVGPYNQIPEAFGKLGAIAGQAGLFAKPGAMCLAIYYDDPETTPADQLTSDAAIVIPDGSALPNGLAEQHIPAGKYAKTTHVGPYEGLGDSWARFMGEWLPSSGYRMGEGTTFEIYANDPMSTPPAELRTDMYVPVA